MKTLSKIKSEFCFLAFTWNHFYLLKMGCRVSKLFLVFVHFVWFFGYLRFCLFNNILLIIFVILFILVLLVVLVLFLLSIILFDNFQQNIFDGLLLLFHFDYFYFAIIYFIAECIITLKIMPLLMIELYFFPFNIVIIYVYVIHIKFYQQK